MIRDIDHVAVKVGSIEACRDAFEELGYPLTSVRQHDEVGMKIAFLGEGASKLELMEVVDPSSPIADHPNGIHHIGMKVSDIETTYTAMKGSSRFSIEGEIRQGAHSRIFFFRIVDDSSTLYECAESAKGD